MESRTRNILIGIMVLFAVMGVGSALILPYVTPEGEQASPGAAEQARGRRLMAEGRFSEAQSVFLQVMQQHRGTAAAGRAQSDKDYGIPYHQALQMAQAGQAAQAQAILTRVAREGAKTEWGPKATQELSRLGQRGPAAGVPATPAAQEEARGRDRQMRLAQANSLLEAGNTEEAGRIFRQLVNEGMNDAVGTAAHLALTTLEATEQAVRTDPAVARARVALHRARASLLAYRGANGRYPPSLQDSGLERFGFSYQDLASELRRVEAYRAEGGTRFEITAVARDPRGTRLRATDRAVEDLP